MTDDAGTESDDGERGDGTPPVAYFRDLARTATADEDRPHAAFE